MSAENRSEKKPASSHATPPDVEQVKALCHQFRQMFRTLHAEVAKVIVGHEDIVEDVLISLFCGGHVLLEGVPGLGKTLLVRTLELGDEHVLWPHPVHAGPDARGHHRHEHGHGGPADGPAPV